VNTHSCFTSVARKEEARGREGESEVAWLHLHLHSIPLGARSPVCISQNQMGESEEERGRKNKKESRESGERRSHRAKLARLFRIATHDDPTTTPSPKPLPRPLKRMFFYIF